MKMTDNMPVWKFNNAPVARLTENDLRDLAAESGVTVAEVRAGIEAGRHHGHLAVTEIDGVLIVQPILKGN